MHTCNLTTALEIFEENLSDIRKACLENADVFIQAYSPYKEINIEEDWGTEMIHQHLNHLQVEENVKPILSTIRRIDSYRQHKQNPHAVQVVTEMDIQRAREADADWFIEQAQLSTKRPHKVICPFHNDSNASLMLMKSKAKGTLYLKCFVCCEAWDSIGFIQKRDNLNFIQAVRSVIR